MNQPAAEKVPRVLADGPLAPDLLEMLEGRVELIPWADDSADALSDPPVTAIYTYGHLSVDGPGMDRFPNLKVISNYGVGVDHIDLQAAALRGIPVGNTPGVVDGATADMGFALLLAAARRVVPGDRYARSPGFTHYDPGYMLGTEVHGATLGIIGLGRIGRQVAQRARGFEMPLLYHNRSRREDVEQEFNAQYVSREALLETSDFVMLTCPLSEETRGMIDSEALSRMRPWACLINLARGPVVNTDALYEALSTGGIAAAALDVTDPEPLPREHPLLGLDNVVITPHLGSATVKTRRRMAQMSVENLLAGLQGQALPYAVGE
jgi:glyoxylate reductase